LGLSGITASDLNGRVTRLEQHFEDEKAERKKTIRYIKHTGLGAIVIAGITFVWTWVKAHFGG
jgi:hypothetical protein